MKQISALRSSMYFHLGAERTKLLKRGSLAIAFAGILHCCVLPPSMSAQEASGRVSQCELAGQYAYTRGISEPGVGFNLNGGAASFAYSISNRLDLVGDFGVGRFSNLTPGLSSTMYTYMAGPRVIVWRPHNGGVTAFAHVLAGAGRLNARANGISAGENSIAVAAGGGLDLSRGGRFAIRLIEAEYLVTRFDHPNGTAAMQNNVRVSAGLVLRFGTH
jgi:hypothetical protein